MSDEDVRAIAHKANDIRQTIIEMLVAAGSGHTAGPLGMADIFAALYFRVLQHDPKNPDWVERDRLILSNGHIVPVRYAAMAHAGYFPVEECLTLRKFGSRLQGHPERLRLPGLETTSGPLGEGLSQASAIAYALRMDDMPNRVYCAMGDGEQDEGNVWEAFMFAGKYQLGNLTAIIDRNNIQIDGYTESVMPLEPLADKYRAFGWHVLEVDGHNIAQFVAACDEANAIYEKPTVIIAHTIPGKGIREIERDYRWHGKPPSAEEGKIFLNELRTMQALSRANTNDMLNPDAKLKENLFDNPDQAATRDGFGSGIVEAARVDARVIALTADLAESTRLEDFKKEFPSRFIEAGVAEQNLAALGSGFAAYGKVPFITSYAAFNPGRNNEQIRTTISLNEQHVIICGMHAGVSVGPDGATHQALEDIALMRVQPHMTVISPCDSQEARKATIAAAQWKGPVYLRFGREKTPIMTTAETPFEIGKANVMWQSDTPSVAIVATGSLLHNALLAAKELQQAGIEVSVINVHTIKPLDRETIVREASRAGAVVSVEEHQVAGGLGSAIAELLAAESPVPMEFIGVHDQFGQSGTPAELIEHYGMGVSHIAEAAKKVVARKHHV